MVENAKHAASLLYPLIRAVPRRSGRSLLLSIAAFLACSLPVFSRAEGKTVTVGVYENAPKVFTSGSGKPSGIFIDILEHIAISEGWELHYVPGTWAEGLDRLAKGQIDLMPDVAYTTDRGTVYSFHEVPVLSSWSQVYGRKGSKIQSILDLNGKRVAVLDHSVQQKTFERLTSRFGLRVTLIAVQDYGTMFEMIAKGNVDAGLTNRFYGLMHARPSGLEDTAVMFEPVELFFAAPKNAPRQLLDIIDHHLSGLKEDHRSAYYASLKRWTSEEVRFKLPAWVQVLGSVLGAVLLMSLGGGFLLRHQVNARTRELKQVNREMELRITEQKRLENQLRHAQKMEAVGTLAGGIAHDFNNILAAIMGYTCIVQKKTGAGSAVSGYLDQILAATKRAAGLTQSLLAFSRKQVIELRPVDINEVIHGFQKMMGRLIGEDIEFSVTYSHMPLVAESDAGQLEHVLMNLITNARDAMPQGGNLMITTYGLTVPEDQNEMPHGPYAVIAVSDTGTGMDKRTQERIFEPFFTTKEAGKGTGLGLAMAYGIITSHKGFIRVYSEPGKGTTFKIYLPLTDRAPQKVPEEEEALLPLGSETVLLAEDDANVRSVTGDMLREFGYTVLEAKDGEDAVRVFQQNAGAVRLVLCDLIMPKKNGKEAMEEIRKISPGMKVVFTSGYTADLIARKGLLEAGKDFLPKPVSTISLIRKVREVLDS